MDTPGFARATRSDLFDPDLSEYLPSYKDIDNHVDQNVSESVYTEAELEQLDSELGMNPRKKARRVLQRRDTLPAELAKKMGEANMMFVNHELVGAAQLLLEIIKEAPEVPDPYHTLGLVYEALGRPKQALQVFVLAAHFAPRDEDMWRRLANMSRELAETEQALHCLTRLLRMAPSDCDALYHRSMIYKEKGDVKHAVDGFKQLVAKTPNCALYLKEYCPLLFKTGKTSAARQLLEEYVASAREILCVKGSSLSDQERVSTWDLTLLNMLCELLMQQSHFEAAKGFINETIDLNLCIQLPLELIVRYGLCHLPSYHCVNGAEQYRIDSFISDVFKLEVSDFPALYLEVSDTYCMFELPHKALSTLLCLESVNAFNNADLWIRLARCYKDLPDEVDATVRYCMRILETHPSDAESRLILSDVYDEQGDKEKAISIVEIGAYREDSVVDKVHHRRAVLPLDSPAISLLFQHCQLCLAESKYQEIIDQSFDKISETLKAVLTRRRLNLELELSAGRGSDPPVRVRSLPSVLTETGDFLQITTILSHALISMGRFDQANALIKPLLRFDWPSNVIDQFRNLRCLAIDLFCHRKDYNRAYVQVTNAILDVPHAVSASPLMQILGTILFRLNYPEKSRRFLDRIIAKHPECMVFRVILGHFAVMKRSYGGACREYLHALSMSPVPLNSSLCFFTAVALLQRSQSPSVSNRNFLLIRSFSLFFAYIRKSNRAPHALYNLGRAFHSVGINHIAEKYYKEAISGAKRIRMSTDVSEPVSSDFLFPLTTSAKSSNEEFIAKNAAFNLSLIYRSSGATELAARLLNQFIKF